MIFKNLFIFNWRISALQYCVVSAVHPHESAMDVCTSPSWASLVAQMVKDSLAMQETRAQSLGQEDPLEKGLAIYSSMLAWETPGQRSLVGYSPWGRRVPTTKWLTYTHAP